MDTVNQALLRHFAGDVKAGRRAVLVKYEELMDSPSLITQIEEASGVAFFDARNPKLRRNKVTKPAEAAFYRMVTAGHGKEVLALTRELDERRLKPQANV